MATLYTLVEGATEERFFLDTIRPHLGTHSVDAMPPQIFRTSRHCGKDYRGGVFSYAKVRANIKAMASAKPAGSRLTTMLDYYALPQDFPGLDHASTLATPQARVLCIESAFAADVEPLAGHLGSGWFIPYIQLHEFEALVLVEPKLLARQFTGHDGSVKKLAQEIDGLEVEDINGGQDTSPSKRIIRHIPEFKGRKALAGPAVAAAIGLVSLRERAPHFGAWLNRIEDL